MKRKLAGSRAGARWRKRVGTEETAFTLIELLVVIAIIGILAALLLPSLTRAKQQAQSAKCKSSLHQLGLALNLYLEDNSSKYPYCGYWYNLSPSQRQPLNWWELYLQPYYGFSWTNTPGFQCPGYKGPLQFWSRAGGQAGSYAYNGFGTSYFQPDTHLGLSGDAYENEVSPATSASA